MSPERKGHWIVGEVLTNLRRITDRDADYNVQYTYVIDEDDRLLAELKTG